MATKSTKPQYAEVAPAVPLPATGKQTYTYRVPARMAATVSLYQQVRIPLGKRSVAGFITELHSRSVRFPTKDIASLSAVTLTAYQAAFANWLVRTMHGSLGYTLRLFTPAKALSSQAATHDAKAPTKTVTPLQFAVVHRSVRLRVAALKPLLRASIGRQQQVLIVVPEKWQVQEVLDQLPKTWRVAGAHSDLTAAASRDVWQLVRAGEVDVVVGTQKALYLPFSQLGLLVVEEEGWHSHKLWDAYPRLDNRYGAEALAAIHDAPIVWSTSYPSVRVVHGIAARRFIPLVQQPVRLKATGMEMTFADRKHKWPVPAQTIDQLGRWLRSGERVLLFQYKHNTAVRHLLHQRFDKHMQKIDAKTKVIDPKKKLLVSTAAVFTRLQGLPLDQAVVLFPEKPLGYPDYRVEEEQVLLLARLQTLLPRTATVHVVTHIAQLVQDRILAHANDGFAALLAERERLQLPPYTDLVSVAVTARSAKAAHTSAVRIREQLEAEEPRHVRVYGPLPSGPRSKKPEERLVLTGPLSDLQALYGSSAIQSADIAPARVV